MTMFDESGWNRPFEENWQGELCQLAFEGQQVELMPMGPNSPSRCVVTIDKIDRVAETVTLFDSVRSLVITWADWCWMRACPLMETS